MTTATLRNGDQVTQATALTIYAQLETLQDKNPTALWDLAMKCKDASHIIFPTSGGDSSSLLKSMKLLKENDAVSEDIRKVVLNSIANIDEIAEDLFALRLRSPFANTQIERKLPLVQSKQLPNIGIWRFCTLT